MKVTTNVWLLGGAGVVLIYSAYKGKNPLNLLRGNLTGEKTSADLASSTVTAGNIFGGASATGQAVATANDLEPKIQVTINGQGMTLAPDAAAAFKAAENAYGEPIPITGAFRTYAQEVKLATDKPGHGILHPSKTSAFHVQGEAIDVNSAYMNDPRLVSALEAAGFRRFDPTNVKGEGMHWNYPPGSGGLVG